MSVFKQNCKYIFNDILANQNFLLKISKIVWTLLYSQKQIFPGHAVFAMTRRRDMDKINQKYTQNGSFSPFVTPTRFFSKIGLCHFCTLIVPFLHAKNLKKINQRSLRYLKTDKPTDQRRTDKGDY